jgi:predicted nucleotidyltransferase
MARVAAKVDRDALQKTKEFIERLQNRGLRIQRAYLFGSHAKGTAHEWSDIDVAIVADNLSGDWHKDFWL